MPLEMDNHQRALPPEHTHRLISLESSAGQVAGMVAAQFPCRDDTARVLLVFDFDAGRLEDRVVLTIPIQIAQHSHRNEQRADNE
jgi:hypothetical protein